MRVRGLPSRILGSLPILTSLSLVLVTVVTACDRTPEPSPNRASVATAAPAPDEPPNAVPAPADVAAAPDDAIKTTSGLAYRTLQPGVGKEHPSPVAQVKVNYTGWTSAGRMFDSTSSRAQPAEFRVDGVIKGWTEGLQLMTKCQKVRFWIPSALAYGDTPRRPGMPAGSLVFDVELLDIVEPPATPPATPSVPPPAAPSDVKAPSAGSKHTESGLAYKVLKKGTGTRHPNGSDHVRVHYTGWTTDGKVFDSSVMRGQPISFGLDHVIKGWTEGVQLMVEGEKTRFWIPGALAYGDKPSSGEPSGTLVFDIELLGIE